MSDLAEATPPGAKKMVPTEYVRNLYHRASYFLRIARGREVYFRPTLSIAKEKLGNHGAEWCIATHALGAGSIVYSFGVGTDISFELSLIDKYGCTVNAFDPTPRSVEWLRSQVVPNRFKFFNYGIADFDGTLMFYPPLSNNHVSFSATRRADTRQRSGVSLPVHKLATIMELNGHTRVDLLKMDIEGSEYAVLRDILQSDIPIAQLLVEFHHRFDREALKGTREAINALLERGYDIFDISVWGEEYSFLRK